MKWKIKITNRKNQRILIEYLPLDNSVKFTGQYKLESSLEWHDFVEIINFDFHQENFMSVIESICDSLDRKIKELYNLNGFFKSKLEIEINDKYID